MLFHEAEDIVLEAAKKRRQAHSQTQSPAGNQVADRGTLQQPSRLHQAPPPPPSPLSQTGNLDGSAASARQAVLPEAADVTSSGPRHIGNDFDDLAVGLGGMHVAAEAQDGQAHGVGTSEQDSEGYWSESQWDSSASYTSPDQQTSDSDHQHDSSDAEHAPHIGDELLMQVSWSHASVHNMHIQQSASCMCTLQFMVCLGMQNIFSGPACIHAD